MSSNYSPVVALWPHMVGVRASGSSGPGSSLCRGHGVAFLEIHFILTVTLSTKAYKSVPANLMLWVTLR